MFSEVNVFKYCLRLLKYFLFHVNNWTKISKVIHPDMQRLPFLAHICLSAYALTHVTSCKAYAKFFVYAVFLVFRF